MRKFLCCLLALVFVLGLTCCVDDAPTNEPASGKYSLNETAVFKELKVTATELKESDGDDFFTP